MVNPEKFCPFTEGNNCYTSCIFYRLKRVYCPGEPNESIDYTICLLEKAAEQITGQQK